MTEQAHKQPFWAAQGLPAPGTRMSAEDFLALPETMTHMELIGGVVVYAHSAVLGAAVPVRDVFAV